MDQTAISSTVCHHPPTRTRREPANRPVKCLPVGTKSTPNESTQTGSAANHSSAGALRDVRVSQDLIGFNSILQKSVTSSKTNWSTETGGAANQSTETESFQYSRYPHSRLFRLLELKHQTAEIAARAKAILIQNMFINKCTLTHLM